MVMFAPLSNVVMWQRVIDNKVCWTIMDIIFGITEENAYILVGDALYSTVRETFAISKLDLATGVRIWTYGIIDDGLVSVGSMDKYYDT